MQPCHTSRHGGFFADSSEVWTHTPTMTTTTWDGPFAGNFDVQQKRFGVEAMKLEGYFVAPYSAYYSFYASGK